MRCQPNSKRAVFLWPWVLLASATGSILAGGPAEGASATSCLQLESRSAVPGMLGCTRFALLRNACDVDVVAEVRRTQHLFSGALRQAFPVVVPAGGVQSLDCVWWSGAMAPVENELVGAQFLEVPARPESRDCHDPNRH